eukprot:s1525_g14.t1
MAILLATSPPEGTSVSIGTPPASRQESGCQEARLTAYVQNLAMSRRWGKALEVSIGLQVVGSSLHAECPWALSSLSLRELRQVSLGNLLMCFILEALVQILCTGGVGLLEHPAAPDDEEAATIWRTPIMRLLLSFPECQLLTLAQGLWGAPSPKPTSLLLINAPEMTSSLRRWQVTPDLPKGISIGVDKCGNWSTSKLKEYPPSMSGGLAEGFLKAIRELPHDSELAVPDDFQEICATMHSSQFGEHYGPDYAGV